MWVAVPEPLEGAPRQPQECAPAGRDTLARAIYMRSAPTAGAANPGIEEKNVLLGCVQPGETPTTFGDSLRRLTDGATFLYVDGRRYWYSTQPSVARQYMGTAGKRENSQVGVFLC
jgi:uncharacterized protein